MADGKHCWELMDHGINLRFPPPKVCCRLERLSRCIEYHEHSVGEDSQNAPHMDEGSAISMTIMLSSLTPLSGYALTQLVLLL